MYKSHRITQAGWIELRETIDAEEHPSTIAPNAPLEKYKEKIEADPNFKKYRTRENTDAYEAMLIEMNPPQEDILQRWRGSATVALYKIKIVLDQMGDLDSIESVIAQQSKAVQIAWENTPTVRRNSDTVAMLAQIMEYTPEQLDEIFQNADSIQL